MRRHALAHLAAHARGTPLAPHLRTCRCRETGCHWHPRHRGCQGGILLALTLNGRTWRLADLCHACAATTPRTAQVPERPALGTQFEADTGADAWRLWEAHETSEWWWAAPGGCPDAPGHPS